MAREDFQNTIGRFLSGAKERFSNIVPKDFQLIPSCHESQTKYEGRSEIMRVPVT